MINKTSLAALLGAVVGALAVSAAVWVAVQQKYLMTRDLTRDDIFVSRSATYHDAWSNMATAWGGSCDIEFEANGEPVFVDPDHDLGVDVNGAPLDQRLVVEAAAFLGDRYAIRCMLVHNSLSSMPTRRYRALLSARYFGLEIPDAVIEDAEIVVDDRREAYAARWFAREFFDAAAREIARERSLDATQNSPADSDADLSGEGFLDAVNAEIMRLETVRRRR